MKAARLGTWMLIGTFVAAAPAACGADDEDVHANDDATASSSGDTSSDAANDSGWDPSRCAERILTAELLPLELTMMLDLSSSMCLVRVPRDGGEEPVDAGSDAEISDADSDAEIADAEIADADADISDAEVADAAPDASNPYNDDYFDCTDPRTRWPAASSALRTFLSSPQSSDITLAVRTFGPATTWAPSTLEGNRCSSNDYRTPDFPATALPSEMFAERIAGISIPTLHPDATQTQTGAVIAGATAYSAERLAQVEGEKSVAMLLVTDGNPQGCDPTLPIPNYATETDLELAYTAAAAASSHGLKLYVLNIGGTQSVLDRIAHEGGTGSAITIDDPTNAEAIGAALAQIRERALSCRIRIPQPTQGEIDYGKINLTWKATPSSALERLPQSAACDELRGWRYDDPDRPSYIELCSHACDEVDASTTGELQVVVGCSTNED